METRFVIILILVNFSTAFWNGNKCPDAFSILPCSCKPNNEGKSIITCERVECGEELLSAVISAKRKKIFMVQLKAVSFMFFPNELFKDTKIKVLTIHDSSIFSLGESKSAFTGLEDSLKALEVSNCSFVNNWEWSELSKMKKLSYLKISSSELFELPNLNISHLPIEDLNFRDNFIRKLPSLAFNKFTQLKRLTLDNNYIRSVERSMLPTPAKNLEAIGLSYNKIKMLYTNTFEQLPALKYLYLGGNPIKTLNEDVFRPIWSQLQMALFQDCPLICDCRIAWITTAKQARVVLMSGKCNSPENFKEKRITQLLPAHFQSCL
ncbi:reticulon-4 receptor [Parasteatoda tepidariorum]|uniref:reticulon-4 receptor n=1 Tax=Parasteatoda tepidariorum TaxID=114398 RepID=UPI00077FCF4C|nr:leucine-rich repeat and immunoglobulin-like domain-containing nogo receptor-interacting protein 1 [Parasteatoda tepidariorum]